MGRAGRAQEAEPSVMTSPHLGADRAQRERGCLASQSELPCGLRQPWASLGHCPSCPGKEPLKFEGALWFLWTGAQRPEHGRALLPCGASGSSRVSAQCSSVSPKLRSRERGRTKWRMALGLESCPSPASGAL